MVGRALSDEQVQAAAAATGRLTLQQQRLLADLLRLRQLVNKAAAKFDQQRLTAFLDAAACGEVEVVQSMLRQGMSPDSADYDGELEPSHEELLVSSAACTTDLLCE
jgi:hypothetical protein